MRKTSFNFLLIGLTLACVPDFLHAAAAQASTNKEHSSEAETKPVAIYRLDFVVRERDAGKVINTRAYAMSVEDRGHARLRVGSRIPITMGDKGVQYQDVGINIDCSLTQQENDVLLHLGFESSSVVPPGETGGVSGNPVFRQVRFDAASSVTPGKPAVISTLDDVATNRRYEVEVTAVKLK